MALTDPSNRRSRPVRLTDVPLEQRYAAAALLARRARDADEAEAILAAALAPSPTVYYVAPEQPCHS